MGALIGGKLAMWIAGLIGTGGALAIAHKLLPGIVAKMAGARLKTLLAAKDEADRALVLALVKWAEKKIPDSGKGGERFKLVMTKIASIFRLNDSQKEEVAGLIEDMVKAADEELRKAAQ